MPSPVDCSKGAIPTIYEENPSEKDDFHRADSNANSIPLSFRLSLGSNRKGELLQDPFQKILSKFQEHKYHLKIVFPQNGIKTLMHNLRITESAKTLLRESICITEFRLRLDQPTSTRISSHERELRISIAQEE